MLETLDARVGASLRQIPFASGLVVMLIGALALIGWFFHIDGLKRVFPGTDPVKANTALGLMLSGLALGLQRSSPASRALSQSAYSCAGAVVLLGVLTLLESLSGWDLRIDEVFFRDPETPRELHPGRMASETAAALVLTGSALALTRLGARHPWAGAMARMLSGAVAAIGILGLLDYAFEAVALYSWLSFGSVAVHTAAAFTLLGVGLLVIGHASARAPQPVSEDHRITQAAALALVAAAGAMGIVGTFMLESQVRRSMEGELQHLLGAQLAELVANLDLRSSRAEIITTRPNLLHHLRIFAGGGPRQPGAREVVQGVLESFLAHDFSMLVVTLPNGEEIARAGEALSPPTLDMPAGDARNTRLVWRHALSLRHRLALQDAEGALGSVVAEQRLPRATHLLTGNRTRFVSAEFLLCSPAGPAFRCFPSRLSTKAVVVPRAETGPPRLAQRAVAEGAGVGTTVDYRGHQVLGAYAPVPGFGLVAVLKVDVDEVYSPVRRQLLLALLLVLTVTVGGVGLVRARVGPLATRLEMRVRERTAELVHTTRSLEVEIVERKAAEQALRESEAALAKSAKRLSILHEIDRAVIAAAAPGAIAEVAVKRLRDLLGVPRVIVNLFDLAAGEVEWLAAAGRRRSRRGPGVRFPLTLMGDVQALRRGELQVIDVDALPRSAEAQALIVSGVHVYMVVPMIAGGELIGGLSFGGASRQFPAEQISIAQEVATQLAIAIVQARLHERVTQHAEELEQRVQERTLELEQEIAERRRAEAAADQANQAKSEFLSRMSHELRTPLNAVLGFAQLLEMHLTQPADKESVDHIMSAGRHLLGLINEVLDISRIEAGRVEISLEPVHVGSAIGQLLDLAGPLAATRRVDLGADGTDLYSRHVWADAQRLRQVLLNLVSNGIKYNREGGRLRVGCSEASGQRIRISVTDTGVGIAPMLLPRLFTPFDRLGADREESVEGTGLGLVLSKRLVELMGGTIGVESAEGTGSTFWVEFNETQIPMGRDQPTHPSTEAARGAPTPLGTVLYVEDNASNLWLVERVLAQRPGVRLIPAMHGRLGLELARQHRPGLILLDVHLSDMSGDHLLQLLRSEAELRDTPVVVLSADATKGQIARLLAGGARAYLTKPLDVRAFLAIVDETLKPRGHA